jgi:hypothetical protein
MVPILEQPFDDLCDFHAGAFEICFTLSLILMDRCDRSSTKTPLSSVEAEEAAAAFDTGEEITCSGTILWDR